jgi:DNA-binding transcriptional MerR regulator
LFVLQTLNTVFYHDWARADLRLAFAHDIITTRDNRWSEDDIVQALTISELERATGVPRSTIHFYLREGLLPRPQKTAGTRSLYSEHHIAVLKRIAEARSTGRSLPEIKAELQAELKELDDNPVDLESQEYKRIHRAILDLATKEFVQKGYGDTRLSDLIRRAGVSSSVFYEHFPTKRRLWGESFCTLVEWSTEYLAPRLAEATDLVDRLLARTAAGFSLHNLNLDLLVLLDNETQFVPDDAMQPVQNAERAINQDIADELAAMRDPDASPPAVPDDTLAYMLNMAFHSGLTRVARDSTFSLLDFIRADIWLWLAVRAAMTGRVDIKAELSHYEDRIRDLVASDPPVFAGFED